MKEISVKTNIMCGSCVAKVQPVLNEVVGEGNWKVDTTNPQKILTVQNTNMDTSELIQAVERAGYKAEKIS